MINFEHHSNQDVVRETPRLRLQLTLWYDLHFDLERSSSVESSVVSLSCKFQSLCRLDPQGENKCTDSTQYVDEVEKGNIFS